MAFLDFNRKRAAKQTMTLQVPQPRHGLTLIEILIALTMTLILLGAMMSAFNTASEGMKESRSVLEMANRARSVEDQLRSDLAALTIDPRVHIGTSIPNGYLEIIERPRNDSTELVGTETYLGDIDDILAMTIRTRDGVLFRGRDATGATIESPLAEVIWFTTRVIPGVGGSTTVIPVAASTIPVDNTIRLHRRELVVRPDLGTIAAGQTAAQVNLLLSNIDISCRVVPSATAGQWDVIANDLTDLARRENRFAHEPFNTGLADLGFPHSMDTALLDARLHSQVEDLMLTDVISFDLQVFSPNAIVTIDTGINRVVEPGDATAANYAASVANSATNADLTAATIGAFVDLGYNPGAADEFANIPNAGSQIVVPTWDNWTPQYESDGIDQDGDSSTDEGTNGLNDGGTAAPDDDSERETAPPYASPIRGLKIKLRLIEKGTNKIYQTDVIQSYVPE